MATNFRTFPFISSAQEAHIKAQLEARDKEMEERGMAFLKRGSVIHVNGIPVELMESVCVRTAPENIKLIGTK